MDILRELAMIIRRLLMKFYVRNLAAESVLLAQ